MLDSIDFSGRPFHFIGVGGIGMSALAYVLARQKLPVSGSDLRLSHITQRLQEEGVHVFWSQDAKNLEFFREAEPGAEPALLPQVICSTAIHGDNAEYQAARELGCPIFHRSDVLAALIQRSHGISVAGTHGKTTTSSLLGHLLLQAGLDPTIVVGGEVNAWGGNAVVGNGPYLVAEADESDGSLVKFISEIGIVTNIELDHPDHYHSLDEVVDIFKTFASHCKILIGCVDCETVREQLKPTLSYSLDRASGADYTVDCVAYRSEETVARVWERGVILGRLNIKLLGQHNLSNALAAVAVGRLLGLDFAAIAKALATFEGARRRFEQRGDHNGILFIDDYAHHPSEVRATLSAARLQTWGKVTPTQRRVVAVFQPHRYSRTRTFLAEFAAAFSDADVVVVTDIYSAGESKQGELDGQRVADQIAIHHPQVYYQPSLAAVGQLLKELLMPGDLALFLGAGNLNQLIPEVMAFHQQVEQGISQGWCNQA
ncbi:MAG TPA: UDP-N-acetylmuramate--L-alanine ligase [Thermosynechococcaceae cyanobacterium]